MPKKKTFIDRMKEEDSKLRNGTNQFGKLAKSNFEKAKIFKKKKRS